MPAPPRSSRRRLPRSPGRGGRGPALPVPGPLSKEPMPTVKFGKYDISRLIIGSNGPGAHFSQVIGLEARAWNTPERVAQQFKHCEELGINCMEDGLAKITKYNAENGGKLHVCHAQHRALWTYLSGLGAEPGRSPRADASPFTTEAPATPARMPGGEEASSTGFGSGANRCAMRACWWPSPATGRKCSWKSSPRAGTSITT